MLIVTNISHIIIIMYIKWLINFTSIIVAISSVNLLILSSQLSTYKFPRFASKLELFLIVSHSLLSWLSMEIARRKVMSIIIGSWRANFTVFCCPLEPFFGHDCRTFCYRFYSRVPCILRLVPSLFLYLAPRLKCPAG